MLRRDFIQTSAYISLLSLSAFQRPLSGREKKHESTVVGSRGRLSPSELKTFHDDITGAEIHQLTSNPSINHHFYYLNPTFSSDGKYLLFTSYRSGGPQLHEIRFPDGDIRQLTDEKNLHPFSACPSPADKNRVYYICGGNIYSLDRENLDTNLLYEFPDSELGECSLSKNGKWLASAIKKQDGYGIVVAATDGSDAGVIIDFPRTIIHPQFHPIDNNWIEFAGDPAPRMHRVRRDGSDMEILYKHDNDEFVVHETFLENTGNLIFTIWPYNVSILNWKTKKIQIVAEFNAWHIKPNRAGDRFICDTNHPDIGLQIVDIDSGNRRTICHPGSSNSGTQWKKSRYALKEDFRKAGTDRESNLSWMETPTDTIYGPQWTHPHPAFSPDEKYIIYTSDVSGHAQIYAVSLDSVL